MIRLYGLNTPNTHKITICLEELALPYQIVEVDVRTGAHHTEAFAKLNPNARIPVVVDTDTNTTVFESNAILLYLASKAGRLMPISPNDRWEAIQWLFFQAASLGPMLGQQAWFNYYAGQKVPYAVERYGAECQRLYKVLDQRLEAREFLCQQYSIVDIAHFGWLHCAQSMHLGFEDYPALTAWYQRIAERPAVQRGVLLPNPLPSWSEKNKLVQEAMHHASSIVEVRGIGDDRHCDVHVVLGPNPGRRFRLSFKTSSTCCTVSAWRSYGCARSCNGARDERAIRPTCGGNEQTGCQRDDSG